MSDRQGSVVTFYRVIDQAQMPQRADRSAGGTLPMRVARYCDSMTNATSFGWYVFPAMSFQLMWDGSEIFWRYGKSVEWEPLDAVQFPGGAAQFDAVAPEGMRGYSPPFLTALAEPGTVQVWSGLIARTAPDWSLLVRATPNFSCHSGFELYEGIVETDRWFGPLFSNLRLTRTHSPIRFKSGMPLAQIQPLPRHIYSDGTLNSTSTVESLREFQPADWRDYERCIVAPNRLQTRAPGSYAVEGRRRRNAGCPVAAI